LHSLGRLVYAGYVRLSGNQQRQVDTGSAIVSTLGCSVRVLYIISICLTLREKIPCSCFECDLKFAGLFILLFLVQIEIKAYILNNDCNCEVLLKKTAVKSAILSLLIFNFTSVLTISLFMADIRVLNGRSVSDVEAGTAHN
jgi:hypothetical protein